MLSLGNAEVDKHLNSPELYKMFEEQCKKSGLTCDKCLNPLKNPHLIELCKHVFCKACVENLQNCPKCKTEFKVEQIVRDSSRDFDIQLVITNCLEKLVGKPLHNLVYASSSSQSAAVSSTPVQEKDIEAVCQEIEKFIANGYQSSAVKLIDEYLMNPKTIEVGMGYIREMIRCKVEEGYQIWPSQLIDKYLVNKPETYEEGMGYIREMIRRRMEENYQTYACSLIDKYLLNKPETYEEGLGYIRDMIRRNIREELHDWALNLINKYLLDKPETLKERMGYLRAMGR